MHPVDSSGFRHVLFSWELCDSVAWKKPREKIHRRDGHADAEEHAGKYTFRAAFPEREGESGHDDGNEREAASDGAGEGRHQNVDSVFPGGSPLGECWSGEKQCETEGNDR